MSAPALRQAWARWRSFADALDLSEGSPDVPVLHARLFRLTGTAPLSGPALAAIRDRLGAAFRPWLGGESDPPDELEALRRTVDACEPGWNALLGLREGSKPDRQEVERVARTAGLAWPVEPF